jgi:dolichol-phosphate mannosyltransferase
MFNSFKKVSIVIPLYNEIDNINNLINEIIHALSLIDQIEYEIICVNDCSNDGTANALLLLSKKIKKLVIINHKENQGQSRAIYNGIKKAKFNVIITIDGDGQNDPSDIKNLLNLYFLKNNLKLVGGIRNKRKDNFIKIFSSRIANFIRRIILKDNCTDTGCSLKIFDKQIFLEFPFFNGIHRFLPALFAGFGHKTKFIPVNHRKRKYGVSKYGTFKRLLNGILDILKVKAIIKNRKIIDG